MLFLWACMVEKYSAVPTVELLLQGVRYFLQSIQFPQLYRLTHGGSESTNSIHSHPSLSFLLPHTLLTPCLPHWAFLKSTSILLIVLTLCGLFLSQDMERTVSLSARIKGGGGVGIAGGGRQEGESHTAPSRPYPPGIHPGGKKLMCVCLFRALLQIVHSVITVTKFGVLPLSAI